jgi:hypothetical protein
MTSCLCNVTLGNITINNDALFCNDATLRNCSAVDIFGSTTNHSISVSSSHVTLFLHDVNVTGAVPFPSRASDVTIIFDGDNMFQATSKVATIGCGGSSNLTFEGAAGGRLSAEAPVYGAGIGPVRGSTATAFFLSTGAMPSTSFRARRLRQGLVLRRRGLTTRAFRT